MRVQVVPIPVHMITLKIRSILDDTLNLNNIRRIDFFFFFSHFMRRARTLIHIWQTTT